MIGVELDRRYIIQHEHLIYLDNDIYEWLLTNAGNGRGFGGWAKDCKWMWTWAGGSFKRDAVIIFSDARVATMFKLRWGGQ